ncbi:MAG: histidine phosphatase family protein, partial [Deltaproteobacteria bacterium]
IARVAWFLGWSPNGESLPKARERSAVAAERLVEHARRERSVVLVGHRIFNMLLASELRRARWSGPRRLAGEYWGSSTFHRGQERQE